MSSLDMPLPARATSAASAATPIVTPIVIGYILATTGSFNGALLFVGLNALVTVLSYLVIVKDIRRIELKHI